MPWQPLRDSPIRLTLPVPLDPSGMLGPTRGQARGQGWRQSSRGFHVSSDVDPDLPEQRVAEASVLLPTQGAVTGWASLCLHEASYFDGLTEHGDRMPVPLVSGIGQSRRPRAGVAWLGDRLDEHEVVVRHGIRCTSVERAVFDSMRIASNVLQATIALDMAAAAELTSVCRMQAYLLNRSRWDGVVQARRAVELADDDSRSPGETWMRVAWVQARFPRPLVNREIFDRGGHLLGIADLVDPVGVVVGEYDGSDHAPPMARSKDSDRDGTFTGQGLAVFRVTGYDRHHLDVLPRKLAAAYDRARTGRGPRGWTLAAPPGWPESPSLEERLTARDLAREAHLEILAEYEKALLRSPRT